MLAPAFSGVSSIPSRDMESAWTHIVAATAYGVRIGVRANDGALLARLMERLPPGSRRIKCESKDAACDFSYAMNRVSATIADAPSYVVSGGSMAAINTKDEGQALDAFESAVRFDVAVTTSDFVFVHAGVVGWRDGAIVIPAPSMHGKSRLVHALVRAGATYYSDEFAVINEHGLVQPFRIPLSIRNDAGSAHRVRLSECGDLPALPIRAVVSTRYEADAVWGPRRGSAGEALVALFANTVRARIAPRETLRVLAKAVEHAVIVAGSRAEAEDVAFALMEGQ